MCSLRSSCLTRVEFGPSRSSLFYGFKIYPPSLPGFVSMYRKFVYRLYHYSSVLLCTFARISKYIKEKELINFFLLPCFDSEGKSRKHKQKQTKVTQFFDKRCNCVAIDKGFQPRSLSALFFFSL